MSHPTAASRPAGMVIAYVTLTIVAAVFTGSAAVFYLIGHEYPRAQTRIKRLPPWWVPMLGTILAAGAAGLVAGFFVPVVGVLAAGGLVLYFLGALVAHLRVGSRNLLGWAIFFGTVTATLVVTVSYRT